MSRALEQALDWQITLWSGDVTPSDYDAFEAWLTHSPENQAAWERLQRVNSTFDQVPSKVAKQVLPTTIDSRRRQILYSLAAIGALGLIGSQAPSTSLWHAATADFHTYRGKQKSAHLGDGTALTLNTDSAVTISFNQSTRALTLKRGEIEVVTGKDTQPLPRPFLIHTSVGNIRPIGTRFTVRQLDDAHHSILVSVSEGAVELSPKNGRKRQIQAGQQAKFDLHSVHSVSPTNPLDQAWTKGLLIAEQQPLGEFLQQLKRYRSGVVRCEDTIKHLRVTGVFPIKDTDSILASLTEVLPIEMHSISKYWITLKQK
ncbi:fec operon regulator FecR [Marinomonas gallaica]|uniref:Fec operon regulator FecR n=1 Tax=Marinomonas gallaica TaxID=1806667 RepID=A0A1C3JTW3_9GAMM|nr:FecR domain-containing protein [Marinomonas gallaica]SBT18526.1 fec operon regulator FecR [Marinomonas gallaica]SBT22765.1 fec operon regulator FecR [Marinomonas gallaica]